MTTALVGVENSFEDPNFKDLNDGRVQAQTLPTGRRKVSNAIARIPSDHSRFRQSADTRNFLSHPTA